MLKAAVIFVQGSSGTLLSRTLTLASGTIPWTIIDNAQNQHLINPSSSERLAVYNNWNFSDWTATERELSLWYKEGINDFENYASSDNLMIDAIHPLIFTLDEKNGLWTDDVFWEKLIFITWSGTDSLNTIATNGKIKRPDLFHSTDTLNESVQIFNELLNKYPDSFVIPWESINELETYLYEVDKLSTLLKLDLDMNIVTALWTKWKNETDKLLNEITT